MVAGGGSNFSLAFFLLFGPNFLVPTAGDGAPPCREEAEKRGRRREKIEPDLVDSRRKRSPIGEKIRMKETNK